jgi:hypothetical protein
MIKLTRTIGAFSDYNNTLYFRDILATRWYAGVPAGKVE